MYKDWVGVPYKHLGRDKKGIDCWGLIVKLFEEKGIKVLDLDYYEADSRARGNKILENYYEDWIKVDELKEMDVILFKYRVEDIASHAGVYIGGGRFIHASKMGVVIDKISRWKDKIIGIYRHKELVDDKNN